MLIDLELVMELAIRQREPERVPKLPELAPLLELELGLVREPVLGLVLAVRPSWHH